MIDIDLVEDIKLIVDQHYKYNRNPIHPLPRYKQMLEFLDSTNSEREKKEEEYHVSDERIIKALEERRKFYKNRVAGAEFALEEENRALTKLCEDIDALKFKKWQHDQCKST